MQQPQCRALPHLFFLFRQSQVFPVQFHPINLVRALFVVGFTTIGAFYKSSYTWWVSSKFYPVPLPPPSSSLNLESLPGNAPSYLRKFCRFTPQACMTVRKNLPCASRGELVTEASTSAPLPRFLRPLLNQTCNTYLADSRPIYMYIYTPTRWQIFTSKFCIHKYQSISSSSFHLRQAFAYDEALTRSLISSSLALSVVSRISMPCAFIDNYHQQKL